MLGTQPSCRLLAGCQSGDALSQPTTVLNWRDACPCKLSLAVVAQHACWRFFLRLHGRTCHLFFTIVADVFTRAFARLVWVDPMSLRQQLAGSLFSA